MIIIYLLASISLFTVNGLEDKTVVIALQHDNQSKIAAHVIPVNTSGIVGKLLTKFTKLMFAAEVSAPENVQSS